MVLLAADDAGVNGSMARADRLGDMGKYVALAIGILMTVAGAVLAFQAFGWISGSSMEGEQFWATVGSVLAGLGVALVFVSTRGTQK